MIEYKVITLRGINDNEDLNVLARDGWRVVTSCPSTSGGVYAVVAVIMSRDIDPAQEPS